MDNSDELSSAIELAYDYGQRLRAVAPNHDLLKYLYVGDNPELDDEFERRFWDKPFFMEGEPGYRVYATLWANYVVVMKNALEHLASPAIITPVGEKGIAQVG